MACHHYHHSTATCSCSHCFRPPPPYPQQSDPLLQALASLFQPQQNHHNLNQTHLLKPFQDQNFATKNQHFRHQHEFIAMMKAGTDWRKASRQYSRERFKSLSLNLMKDGSLQLHDAATGQAIAV
ncbi:hypothetical protein HRI_004921600 [Hibiscus trionum]|uniref:Uncharacterized protein n=1 Tax=Hibiscus trionum TaxID=183268 RepID=A0A9W7JJ21_HIBTR|nr:hypothetical protein HRI_004921600 [Hibiscus trionum]